ncbi:hypothetical protein PT974_04661 [Cladobotryum mycophilum]|uniref:Metallo-beta-lactamase domain-containing protein n=1 Tax=Cladobotryum mycophilum TaxID=491253 RepID=A0ABR0SWS0_9HYPO
MNLRVLLLTLAGVCHLALANLERSNDTLNASELLENVIESLGGMETLESIHGLEYSATGIYRTQTLTQNYNLYHSDQSVSEAGSETLWFDFSKGLKAHIDRYYRYNDYWIWAQPTLDPAMNYSIVLQDGKDGFACFVKGQNSFFVNDPTQALGYTDPFLADYLIHQTRQFALPLLLKQMMTASSSLRTYSMIEPGTENRFHVLELPDSELSLVVNMTSYVPYKIRSYEQHATFGNSTNDVLFSNYSAVSVKAQPKLSFLLPFRLQTIYNSATVLEDVKLDSISINPIFKSGFFDPVPEPDGHSSPQAPQQSVIYPRSEVHEFFEAGLWGGPFESFFNTSDVVVEYPVPGIPQIMSVYVGYADYVQLVINFTDGVLITDAPQHRSRILIKWISDTLHKSVKYVVPSHHHRDHAGGVADYVAVGATVVVPEIAKAYYSAINGGDISFITYNESSPFVLKDANVQFRSMWRDENPHARDWSYGIATAACPTEKDGIVAFNADVWSPDPNDGGLGDGVRFDVGYARQWLDAAVVVGAHGGNTTTDKLESLLAITGYEYPAFGVKDWKAGGALCCVMK